MRESAVMAARRVDLERADAVGGAGENFGAVEAERIWPDRPIHPSFIASEAAKAGEVARAEAERVETEAKAAASRAVDALEASVAATALDAVLKCRGKQHGDFTDHARITQNLKAVMVDPAGKSNWNLLSATQREALEMIQHKIGRILAGDPNHVDHWLDIEGYARIARERL